MKWSERLIGRELATQIFNRKYLVVVPNCNFTGNECDILAVTENLRIVDVEVKISRADLKADAKKLKWYHNYDWRLDGKWLGEQTERRPRQWPSKVWKHYYALPEDIWTPELLKIIAPVSGVITRRRTVTSLCAL